MNLHFDKALEILGRTLPFVLLRLLAYVAALVATVLWFGGLFLLFTNWSFPGPAWIVWPIGAILYSTGAKLTRNYVLYLLKAGHIVVITRLVTHRSLPEGVNQVAYGVNLVLENFLRVSALFAVDRVVNVVIRAFNRSVFRMLSLVPGSRSLRKFSQRVLDYSAGFVDEAILSYSLLHPERNPWSTAREGLLLYAQNWKTILGSGVILALISYGIVALVAVPAVILSLAISGTLFQFWVAGDVALGMFLKFALVDPFALTSIIVNFHSAIEGQQPDPSVEAKLEAVSKKYRQIKDRAGILTPSSVPPPPPRVSPKTA